MIVISKKVKKLEEFKEYIAQHLRLNVKEIKEILLNLTFKKIINFKLNAE